MKVLVIYSHTYHEKSYAGKAILEVLKAQPNVEIRNLEELYPDLNKIDIAAEQEALVGADVIIFHHPVFWFSVPAAMKCYLDEVFQYGFAYGTGGDKLKGKKFIHSYTTGSGAATYEGSEFGSALTLPLKCTAAYTQMEYVGAFPLYGQLSLTNPNIAQEAREHAEKLVSLLKTL